MIHLLKWNCINGMGELCLGTRLTASAIRHRNASDKGERLRKPGGIAWHCSLLFWIIFPWLKALLLKTLQKFWPTNIRLQCAIKYCLPSFENTAQQCQTRLSYTCQHSQSEANGCGWLCMGKNVKAITISIQKVLAGCRQCTLPS